MTRLAPCPTYNTRKTCTVEHRCEWKNDTCDHVHRDIIASSDDICSQYKKSPKCVLQNGCKWFGPTSQCVTDRAYKTYDTELNSQRKVIK